MNPSILLTIDSGNVTGERCSKNVTSQNVNKSTAMNKRRQIDRSHITTLPGIPEMYKCNICKKVFRNRKAKCYHDSCVTGVRPYECSFCEKSFIKRSHFEYHERVHTGYKPFECSLCGKAFPQKNKLNRHMISHKQEKQFICQKCDKRYSKKEDLRNHVSLHTGLSQHVCKSCGKAFRISANLARHMHTHSDERPYVCEFCKKSFKDKSLLMRHKKTHGKDRPFSCAHCNRFFLSKSELSRHVAIHTDIKPFSCTYCHTVFRRKDNLNRHIRHHHAENSISNDTSKPEKHKNNEKTNDATKSTITTAASVVNAPNCSKSIRIGKNVVKKPSQPPESVSLSNNSSSKPRAVSLVGSRDKSTRKESLGTEITATATTTIVPISIRRPGELSNAVPVINGPIVAKNRATDGGQQKKTFTHTEPITLAEAAVINRRIEEKLYPQSSGSNISINNYYFFRKHPSANDSTTSHLDNSLSNIIPDNNSESYNFNNAKSTVVTCNRVQIGLANNREVLSHTYSINSASDLTNSTEAGNIQRKCDDTTPKLNDLRGSLEKYEMEPKPLGFTDRIRFSGIESANSVPTIRINKRIYLQEKRISTSVSEETTSDN